MTDRTDTCGRCSESISGDAFMLSLKKDSSESAPQDLRLCPRCVESFDRWARKHGTLSSPAVPASQSERSSVVSIGSRLSGARRRKRSKKQQGLVIRGIVITFLTLLLFLLTFYVTWKILNRSPQIEE